MSETPIPIHWLWNALFLLSVLLVGAGLCVMAYLDRVYRELGRMTTRRIRENLEIFEAEIEPLFGLERRRAILYFTLLAQLWLVAVAVVTAMGVSVFNASLWHRTAELVIYLTLEVALGMYFIPHILVTRTTGRWVRPLVPAIKLFIWLAWPIRAGLDLATSLLHLGDEAPPADPHDAAQESIEAMVEQAEEDGILGPDEADLIEQVVEFSDKRVHEVMTPRPEIVALPATATIEQLRRLVVETKYSRIPVYDTSLDDIVGIAFARDLLQVPDREAGQRLARELMRPAIFVPEAKLGSHVLKELQQKNQQMAIVVDEYGSVSGVVTAEDLVEEIVGEIGEEDRPPLPDAVRDSEGLVLRGSVGLEKAGELLGRELDRDLEDAPTTIAGLVTRIAGRVPAPGEVVEFDGLRFEVLEANQRKVLRLRVRRAQPAGSARAAESA
jgi:putative hemolysin